MQTIETFVRPAFVNDHPVITATKLFAAGEASYKAGSVLGVDESGNLGMWTESSADVAGILAEDVECSADEPTPALIYVHANVDAKGLVWDDSVTDEVIASTAIPALRAAGIFA